MTVTRCGWCARLELPCGPGTHDNPLARDLAILLRMSVDRVPVVRGHDTPEVPTVRPPKPEYSPEDPQFTPFGPDPAPPVWGWVFAGMLLVVATVIATCLLARGMTGPPPAMAPLPTTIPSTIPQPTTIGAPK